eukprot:GHVT01038066.1.p1 GENE.GHVT01038066.1~~GHVT01038066.1.p1  ORF type:complete len:124 (+),score=7.76 GHVT01038066.1:1522-1893(+)
MHVRLASCPTHLPWLVGLFGTSTKVSFGHCYSFSLLSWRNSFQGTYPASRQEGNATYPGSSSDWATAVYPIIPKKATRSHHVLVAPPPIDHRADVDPYATTSTTTTTSVFVTCAWITSALVSR